MELHKRLELPAQQATAFEVEGAVGFVDLQLAVAVGLRTQVLVVVFDRRVGCNFLLDILNTLILMLLCSITD